MELDDWIINDLTKYTKVPVRRFKSKRGTIGRVFSWNWLLVEFVKEGKNFRKMKWWTWKEWKKQKDTAKCPGCGAHNFDID